jgi:undecaprenyl-diphosphatase
MEVDFKRLIELDARLSSRVRLQLPERSAGLRRGLLWWTAVLLAHSGDSWLCIGAFGLVWLLTSGEWHRSAALFVLAIGVQALIIFPLKQLIRRERPQGEWGSIYRSVDPHSFPSGHATRAFLLAVMAMGLGPQWFALAMVVWAPLVSLARVATGVHYLTDVLGGAVIGLLMGLVVLALRGPITQLLPFLFI